MSNVVSLVITIKAIVLVLGALVTYYAGLAYRRTGSPALRALSIGFGLVTLGALSAGVVDVFLSVGRDQALVVESLFTAGGFGVILYSLYVD
ncbi:MAG: hypothetical protein ABEJ57_03495 [Halobacteriaceae archaeon]